MKEQPMSKKRPRDYRAYGSSYDALALSVISHRLMLLEASMLVDGEEIETELATIDAILDDRRDGIHRPIVWGTIDRDVCTCALVLPTSPVPLTQTVGHVDSVTFRPEGTIVVVEDEQVHGVCQHCALTYRVDAVGEAKRWQEVHVCPPDEPRPSPKFGPIDFKKIPTQEAFFAALVEAQRRDVHPRSDGRP